MPEGLAAWWTTLEPWVQGLFGGAGATLLWEAVLRPVRARRSLALALSAETGFNIQYAAGSLAMIKHNALGVPGDFAMSVQVFGLVCDRLGELPRLIHEIVHLYRRAGVLNQLREDWGVAVRDHRAAVEAQASHIPMLESELDAMLVQYHTGLKGFVEHANSILPRLRRAATPWYRLDLLLRRPTYKSMVDLDREVAEIVQRQQREVGAVRSQGAHATTGRRNSSGA